MRTQPLAALTLAAFVALTLGCQSSPKTSASGETMADTPVVTTGSAVQFGEPVDADAQATPASQVLANPDQYDGKAVHVTGSVSNVCHKRGCWLTIGGEDGKPAIFVKFTCPIEEDRLIPMAAIGKPVTVSGKLVKRKVSESFARHLLEDANASPEEIAAVTGPQDMYFIASPGARIEGLAAAGE